VLDSLNKREVLVELLGRVQHIRENESRGDGAALSVEDKDLALSLLDSMKELIDLREVDGDIEVLIILTRELLVLEGVLEGVFEIIILSSAIDDVSDTFLGQESLGAVVGQMRDGFQSRV